MPCLYLPAPRQVAHPIFLQEGAFFIQLLTGPEPPVWGSGQQWGTASLVPMEGASSPMVSLIQATGSCAVVLRQLFLAWRIPARSRPCKPVPMGRRSSSPGAPPGSVPPPPPTHFLFRVWVGLCRAPEGFQDGQGCVWEGGLTWQGQVPSKLSSPRPCPRSGSEPSAAPSRNGARAVTETLQGAWKYGAETARGLAPLSG